LVRCRYIAAGRGFADALALLAARLPPDELLLTMSRLASINKLLATLSLRSRRSTSYRRIDGSLVLALACTALTVAAAIALVHFHNLDLP
jgi:hypothetical protein